MSNTDRPTFPVVIDAGNDMTEIAVVDGRFNRVAHGIRRLELDLPAGLFMVKTRVGQSTRERFISVPEQLSLIDAHDDTPATSAAPGIGAAAWNDAEMAAENELRSIVPHPQSGEGVVSVWVRDPDLPETPPDEVTLRDLNGARIIRLGDPAASGDAHVISRGPISGFSVRLPAGGYVLQARARNINTVGMPLWVSAGFETRVYLERRLISSVSKNGSADRRRTADLSTASINMVRPRTDISTGPAAEAARITEMARATLAVERPIFPHDVLIRHLGMKFEFPSVGILGAHLLALQTPPDLSLLKEVAHNLDMAVPGHPDVRALRLFLGFFDGPPIDCPPMLRASWSIISNSAATNSALIMPGSVAEWVGTHVTASRPWLIWNGVARRGQAFDESADGEEVYRKIGLIKSQTIRRVQTQPSAPEGTETARPAVKGSRLASQFVDAMRSVDMTEGDPLTNLSERMQMPRGTVANELRDLTFEDVE